MRVAILYHSTTGNTALAARRIAQGLNARGGQAECLDIVSDLARTFVPERYDLIGVGCPVQAWKPTVALLEFIRELPTGSGRPAFAYCSHGGQPANTLRTLSHALADRGYVSIAGHDMPASDNWPILHAYASFMAKRGRPTSAHIRDVDRFSARLHELTSRALSTGHVSPVDFPFRRSMWHVLGRMVRTEHLRKSTGRKSADPGLCTRCGQCASMCPAGAIRLDPEPVFDDTCQGCWACYNMCPQKAIRSSALRGREAHFPGPDWSILEREPLLL